MPYQHDPSRSLVGIMPEITRLAREQAGRMAPAPIREAIVADPQDLGALIGFWHCNVCGLFFSAGEAEAHIADYERAHRVDCSICGVFFESVANRREHELNYHQADYWPPRARYVCGRCPFAAWKKSDFDTRSHDGHGIWACGLHGCEATFPTKKGRDGHTKAAHGPAAPSSLPPWNDRLRDPRASLVGVVYEITEMYHDQAAANSPTYEPARGELRPRRRGGYSFICEECWVPFATEEEGLAHLADYERVHVRTCHVCGVGFETAMCLREHVDVYHEQTRALDWRCFACPHQASWYVGHDSHMRDAHQLGYTCGRLDCALTFTSQKARDAHRASHRATAAKKESACTV